nr:EF-hand domain-containing protein [Sphingomonas vulcanisoli]
MGSAAPLAAQSAPPPEGFHHGYGGQHGGRLFISPMGEPFRDSPDNAAAWFAQADADHDGRLTLAEFRADALRFFATLDTDHDHEIGPEEIDHYEQVIAPETASGGGFGDGAPRSGGQQGGGHRGGGRGGMGGGHGGGMGGGGRGGGMGGGASPDSASGSDHPSAPAFDPSKQGAARFSYLALPEPVIAADTDFNRGVSEQEFLAAASRRFALLDPNHDGIITFDELPKLDGGGIGPPRGRHGSKALAPSE